MRWALALIVAFSVGCQQRTSPVQPSAPTTPAGTSTSLTILGQVTESDTNTPVEGATVCWSETLERRCAQTGMDGTYVLVTDRPHIPATARSAKLAPGVSKDGFEYRQSWVPYDLGNLMRWSPGLQRIVRIEAGRSFAGTVFPQEGSGILDEDDCESCKRIQIAIQRAGTVTLRLTADRDDLRLALTRYDKRSVDAPISVTAGENLIILVTGAITPTRFELSTVFNLER
jgi:hypothetical protein